MDAAQSDRDTENFILLSQQKFANNDGFQVGLWHQNQFVGCAGFHGMNWANKKTSIGYWLAPAFQGKGLMTKTCQTLAQYAFQEYKLNRIEIACATENKKSRAIPERLGFKHEGTARSAEILYGRVVDHEIYSLIISDILDMP